MLLVLVQLQDVRAVDLLAQIAIALLERLRTDVGEHAIRVRVRAFEQVTLLGDGVRLRTRHLLVHAIRIRVHLVHFLL
uniref:Putative secreted protein n=1 Tax=Anopheles darlingi TaxID=43151 RepID=A0A2M4DFK6_ANODA